uniref:U6 small nuclear RNA (adenine-(43)-N(6))-methyltransferase n=1 Tax=Acrobeloides nanus TaxID=290746 RepID=A0A914DWJ5_9BILA
MHPKNPYKDNPPDFQYLAKKFPEFRAYCTLDIGGKVHLNFEDPDAVRVLAQTLLREDFDLDVELPSNSLIPRVPQRLNYILWIDDLLKYNGFNENVIGIDIGTGASCIYPLLGAKLYGWHFFATDVDKESIRVAEINVEKNFLSEHILVLPTDGKHALQDVIRYCGSVPVTFCMCNPPFFLLEESSKKFIPDESGVLKNLCGLTVDSTRNGPRSVTVAKEHELAIEGGEVAFVSKIIEESVALQKAVRIYTSMVGKKASMVQLKKKLSRLTNVNYTVSTLSQGRTQRWVLAWSFDPTIQLTTPENKEEPRLTLKPKKKRKEGRQPKPLIKWFKEIASTVKINCENVDIDLLSCDSPANILALAREKRKATTEICLESPKKFRPDFYDQAILARFGEGDGRDSLSNAGNFSSVETFPRENTKFADVSIQTYLPVPTNPASQLRFHVYPQPGDQEALSLKLISGPKYVLNRIHGFYEGLLEDIDE